ncbi:hypothetical protein NP493_195g05022 [Ridgeia piscesae]|uniref:Fibronectin type-III domain-containing protein n=1 Tax=Ridgeia piscesae TaxID=27915 RepID=A0AAD9P1R9_RIDPI|nr:hypothetical protein NP493_195g05022 [Ridgeia piscesae]
MYFGRMSGVTVRIPARFQHVINPRILQLRHPRMKIENEGPYACYMNESSIGGNEATLLGIPAQVQVDYPPDPVTSVTCISDNFESMICSWCPAELPSKLTKWILEWRVGSASGDCSGYFNLNQCSCEFCGTPCPSGDTGRFMRYLTYQMNFTVEESELGSVRSSFRVRTMPKIVRPRKVQDLMAETTGSTSMRVAWRHPIHLHPSWFPLVYELSYKADWPDEDLVVMQVGNDTSVQLTGLWPATNYHLSVRCRPLSGQYWSNSTSVRIKTPEDAPSAPPNMLMGSFRTHSCRPERENCRSVTVFWQPIKPKYSSGVLQGYEVTCRRVHDGNFQEVNVDLLSLSETFTGLDVDQHYVIKVVGYNMVGRSPPAIINLPPSNHSELQSQATRGAPISTSAFNHENPVLKPFSCFTTHAILSIPHCFSSLSCVHMFHSMK